MAGVARLAVLGLVLAAGTACGRMHSLAAYYDADDTGPADTATDTDLGVDTHDTGPVDTDTGPVDTGTDTGGTTLCSDTCIWPADGWCDDGGPGSDFSLCSFGTDCTDCGPRYTDGSMCTDDCLFYMDGECDDGGPGSVTDFCDWGTDCSDCGPR